jgi:hypothetical protein
VPPDPTPDQEGVTCRTPAYTDMRIGQSEPWSAHYLLPGIGYEEPIASIPDRIFGTGNMETGTYVYI